MKVVLPLWVDPSAKIPRATAGQTGGQASDKIFIKLQEDTENARHSDWATQRLQRWIENNVPLSVTPFAQRLASNSWGRIVLSGPIQTLNQASSLPSAAHILLKWIIIILIIRKSLSFTHFIRAKQVLVDQGVIHEGQIIQIPSCGLFRCSCYPERIAKRW